MLFTYKAHSPLTCYPHILRLSLVVLFVLLSCLTVCSRRIAGHVLRSRFARLWRALKREESSSKAGRSILTTAEDISDD
jgi:hypothetical protein